MKDKRKIQQKMNAIIGKWAMWYKINLIPQMRDRYAHLSFLDSYYRLFDWWQKGYFNSDLKEIKKVYREMIKDREAWHRLNAKIKRYSRDRHAGLYNERHLKKLGVIA